jgi:hypothetical protein
MLLGLGLVASIIAQALFNISVVLSLVPTKGIPLPFISYGGSSLVPTLVSAGILMNISQYANAGGGVHPAGGHEPAGAKQDLKHLHTSSSHRLFSLRRSLNDGPPRLGSG